MKSRTTQQKRQRKPQKTKLASSQESSGFCLQDDFTQKRWSAAEGGYLISICSEGKRDWLGCECFVPQPFCDLPPRWFWCTRLDQIHEECVALDIVSMPSLIAPNEMLQLVMR